MLDHVQGLLDIEGAELIFGGKELTGHSIPDCYGAIEPTLVSIPLSALHDEKTFALVTTEVFGPVQVIVFYEDNELDQVLDFIENLEHRLTAAIISNDEKFCTKVMGCTTNGTTYRGLRARTTGAPENHWFGPTGPNAAGIGTDEAIRVVWSSQREVIFEMGGIPEGWELPAAS